METRKVQVTAMIDKISAAGNPYNMFTFCSDTNATLKDKIVPREYQELCMSALKSTSWLTIEIEKKPGNQPGRFFFNILKVYPFVANKAVDSPPMPPVEVLSNAPQSTQTPSKIVSPIIDKFNADDARTRSMALSYAKDLCVGSKIGILDVEIFAEKFFKYIVSGALEI